MVVLPLKLLNFMALQPHRLRHNQHQLHSQLHSQHIQELTSLVWRACRIDQPIIQVLQ
jgi:hypothetical protein